MSCDGFCGLILNSGVCLVRFSALKCLPGQSDGGDSGSESRRGTDAVRGAESEY